MKYCSNGLVQPPTSDEPSNPSDFAGVSLPFSEAQLPGDGVKVLDMESRCRSKPENPMDGRGLSKSGGRAKSPRTWDGHFLKPLYSNIAWEDRTNVKCFLKINGWKMNSLLK